MTLFTGEQTLQLLEVVAESGKLDPVEYATKANAYFGGPYTGNAWLIDTFRLGA